MILAVIKILLSVQVRIVKEVIVLSQFLYLDKARLLQEDYWLLVIPEDIDCLLQIVEQLSGALLQVKQLQSRVEQQTICN